MFLQQHILSPDDLVFFVRRIEHSRILAVQFRGRITEHLNQGAIHFQYDAVHDPGNADRGDAKHALELRKTILQGRFRASSRGDVESDA